MQPSPSAPAGSMPVRNSAPRLPNETTRRHGNGSRTGTSTGGSRARPRELPDPLDRDDGCRAEEGAASGDEVEHRVAVVAEGQHDGGEGGCQGERQRTGEDRKSVV